MKNPTEYQIVDFLCDDSFVLWATGKSLKDDKFWSAWPHSHPAKAEVFYQAQEIACSLKIKPVEGLSNTEVQQLIGNISSKTINKEASSEPHSVKRLYWFQGDWIKVAAILVLVSIIGVVGYLPTKLAEKQQKLAQVETGLIIKTQPGVVRLPDNSTVILKPGGKLSYNSRFDKQVREVYLDGEAFFEVAKDVKRPFIVHTNELITKVLGTSFSVKAYENAKEFQVTVNTGKVSVFPKKDNTDYSLSSKSLEVDAENGIVLTPNQEVTFYRNKTKLVTRKLPQPAALSNEATERKFNFVETPFSEVIAEISKAYDIKISYDKEKMGNCPLTASLSKQQLYEKLGLICQAVEASYRIENGEIIINGKGCTTK